jgi:lysyl endopeptidase
MIRRLAWILALLAFGGVAHAAPEGAVPTASRFRVLDVNRLDSVAPAPLDLDLLGKEDAAEDRKGMPQRFAVPERVSITPSNHGTWEDLGNGEMLWRLRILGREGSTSLNLGFTRFRMSKGSRLLLYSTDGREVVRPFTAADNEGRRELWTPVVVTRDLMVELTVPKSEVRDVVLKLGWINQGYRGFGTVPGVAYEKSGSCEMDTECLASTDSWRQQARSVGVISTGGSRFCSGSLVNDTAGDRKMYFMTANHCGITSANAGSLVVYWNYRNSFCRTPGSAQSGAAGDGTLTQFHTGSTFRAANATSDFTLVELVGAPVASYQHFWAGWDRSTGNFACSASTPCATIHHPNTDEKRITYSTTTTATTSYSGTTSPGNGSHLWVHWATDPPGPFTVPGVTEPGSSGSPLYSQAGRYIGQLHGGPSSCGATGNNLSDYYGRFSVSWTGGGTNSTRLSNWLDAGNTGATAINGLENSGCSAVNAFVSGPSSEPLHVSSTYTASFTGSVASPQYWWSLRFHSPTSGWSGWSTPFQSSGASTTASLNSCGYDQFELKVEIRSAACPGTLGSGSEVVTITGAC